MNWIFHGSGVKPKHLEECFAIESRERLIIPFSDIAVAWCYLEDVFDTLQSRMDINELEVMNES